MLAYRTRGDSTPSGKPKVYFTCHPAEFSLYFDAVAQDLLHAHNCAVWYEPSGERVKDREELYETVNTMQVIVIAVTGRFLTEANPARDILLPYAREQHIPIVPIVVEQGNDLWLKFNRLSGGIQMLDRTDQDETAIPYGEKLERILGSILIDDRLAATVRNAFDAYVFLSYRKKDRKYANALMRSIHLNRQCRDIAIWFDEYLVPGENFTEGIEKALKKSQIFAMVVTPNLLEPNNYVLEYEYRDAKAAKKIIVPVEMADTDHEQMHSSYAELPDIQKFGNRPDEQQAVHARFLEALKRMAITANDDNPEHNFLIGLAYLSGIDVEINRTRAAELILGASESGCMAATQKLVLMYRNGEGVARDPEKELAAQERLVSQRRSVYESHPDIDLHLGAVTGYFRSLTELSDLLRERKLLKEAISAAEQALALHPELSAEVGTREAERDRALVLNRLGGICTDARLLPQAREYYAQVLQTYRMMADEIMTHRARRDLSIGLERLGDIDRKQNAPEDALTAYREVERIRRKLAEESLSPQARRDLSVIVTKLGSAYKERGDYETASDYYREAVALDQQLEAEQGTVNAKRDLSISTEKLGHLLMKHGMMEEARQLLENTVALRREIYQKTGNEKHKEELEYALHYLAKANK